MRVTIAARRSELARIQAVSVGEALQAAHPSLTINYSFHESLGDRNQNDPLWQMPAKGVFTQDLRAGLLAGQYDLAVHSWKDLAIEESAETEIAATLPRADTRDVLLVRADRWEEIERSGRLSILTSSPRRSHNLDSLLRSSLPARLCELNFVPVRGNVPTRVRKMWQPGADGLVVAKAALDRLLETTGAEFADTRADLRRALSLCRWMVLPLRANPTAPGQGALAIETKRDRADLQALLAPINCAETFAAVTREREILSEYGGGCHQKIGVSVLLRPYGEITFLRGLTDDGATLNRCLLRSSQGAPAPSSREEMWPLETSDADWFAREEVSVTMPDNSAAFWVSKADAFPKDWRVRPSQIVWASGLRTWRRLAERGVWVNGCAESLGEQEHPRIETLADEKLNWLKLTHADACAENGMRSLPTYRLLPKDSSPDLNGKTHFFWTSGSGFERALKLNPWIAGMTHFCGPGNTQRILQRNGLQPFVVLDHAQWLEEMASS